MNPTILLATPGEFQGKEIFIRLFLFLLCAFIFFAAGVAGQINGKAKPWVKYLTVLPLIGGIMFGMPYFRYANDSFNRSAGVIGGNSLVAYNLSMLIPAILLIVVVVVFVIMDKRRKADSGDF